MTMDPPSLNNTDCSLIRKRTVTSGSRQHNSPAQMTKVRRRFHSLCYLTAVSRNHMSDKEGTHHTTYLYYGMPQAQSERITGRAVPSVLPFHIVNYPNDFDETRYSASTIESYSKNSDIGGTYWIKEKAKQPATSETPCSTLGDISEFHTL